MPITGLFLPPSSQSGDCSWYLLTIDFLLALYSPDSCLAPTEYFPLLLLKVLFPNHQLYIGLPCAWSWKAFTSTVRLHSKPLCPNMFSYYAAPLSTSPAVLYVSSFYFLSNNSHRKPSLYCVPCVGDLIYKSCSAFFLLLVSSISYPCQ